MSRSIQKPISTTWIEYERGGLSVGSQGVYGRNLVQYCFISSHYAPTIISILHESQASTIEEEAPKTINLNLGRNKCSCKLQPRIAVVFREVFRTMDATSCTYST